MAADKVNWGHGFLIHWRIENFKFCCLKTGGFLQTPLFNIDASRTTNWRLWLYPRGEDDGEYVSCYLFRALGGPETVDVDFELTLFVGKSLLTPPISFTKIHDFKMCDKWGLKCYVRRREIFLHKEARSGSFALTLRCNILRHDGRKSDGTELFFYTTIPVECISAVEVIDVEEDLRTAITQEFDVKDLLCIKPLISIHFSYFEKSLVIKISPKSCQRIKCATCKITVVRKWLNESPIEHTRAWVGEIESDVWRYQLPLPKTDSANTASETPIRKAFYLIYNFEFSTEEELECRGFKDSGMYVEPPKVSLQKCLDANVSAKRSLTALDALEFAYRSGYATDLELKGEKKLFRAHKSFLCVRVPRFNRFIEDNVLTLAETSDKNTVRAMLWFLYTDKVEFFDFKLYCYACVFEISLLKTKCAIVLKDNIDCECAGSLYLSAHTGKRPELKAVAENYILEHDDEVFSSYAWQALAENKWDLIKEVMLLSYSKKRAVL